MIEGVIVMPLKKIADDRGKVMHMLRVDSPFFTIFGEIYFSVINPGVVKAWKRHNKMTQNITVPVGEIRLVIYDDRRGFSSYGKLDIFDIGEDNYCLVSIPPLVWYGFKGISESPALIANCTDIPHEPSEIKRIGPFDGKIPYDWGLSDE